MLALVPVVTGQNSGQTSPLQVRARLTFKLKEGVTFPCRHLFQANVFAFKQPRQQCDPGMFGKEVGLEDGKGR